MENIKFIKEIFEQSKNTGVILGNLICVDIGRDRYTKLYCEENGVVMKVIHKIYGTIDEIMLPFSNYFEQKQVSPNAPKWSQHINGGKWFFDNYDYCLPTKREYQNIAKAIDDYIEFMK